IGTNPEETIRLPSAINKSQTLEDLICSIYPRLQEFGTVTTSYLTECTILSTHNDDVSSINTRALEMMPGKEIVYLAADILSKEDSDDWTITNRYLTKYINSLDPPGLPAFKLMLKVGCPTMLLRNIAPKDGLCNGTRLMVVRCVTRLIEAMILIGEKAKNLVFIPRISLSPTSGELPFTMTRRQFSLRLSFAMTINKSQG
ncbi:hypothetical protein GIB67_026382, partial [Kingdonia uniflora]